MEDLKMSDLMIMQDELQEKYKGIWSPIIPETGKNSLLWMVEEVGEVAAIFKKRGHEAIMEDPAVRSSFVEEMSDILMYYVDVLMSFDVTAEEFSKAYKAKHKRNMERDFTNEHAHYLEK